MSNRKMIYLDDAVKALENALLSWSYMPEWRDEKIKNALAEVPSAQPMRKKGRWKGEGLGDYRCSLCGEVTRHKRTRFCPNCGARMEGCKG